MSSVCNCVISHLSDKCLDQVIEPASDVGRTRETHEVEGELSDGHHIMTRVSETATSNSHIIVITVTHNVTISVLQAYCAVITTHGIPSENKFKSTAILQIKISIS